MRAQLLKMGDITEGTMQLNDFPSKTGYAREQARAEYLAARDKVHALTAEDSGAAYLDRRLAGVNTRATMGASAR